MWLAINASEVNMDWKKVALDDLCKHNKRVNAVAVMKDQLDMIDA